MSENIERRLTASWKDVTDAFGAEKDTIVAESDTIGAKTDTIGAEGLVRLLLSA